MMYILCLIKKSAGCGVRCTSWKTRGVPPPRAARGPGSTVDPPAPGPGRSEARETAGPAGLRSQAGPGPADAGDRVRRVWRFAQSTRTSLRYAPLRVMMMARPSLRSGDRGLGQAPLMRVIVSECGASRKTLEKSDENGEFVRWGVKFVRWECEFPLTHTHPPEKCVTPTGRTASLFSTGFCLLPRTCESLVPFGSVWSVACVYRP